MKDNPKIALEIENRILANAGIVEKAMMEGKISSDIKDKTTGEEKIEVKEGPKEK